MKPSLTVKLFFVMMKQIEQTSPRVLVLVDNRRGNANQAIDLAEKLGEKFEIKTIKYNIFGKLPNFFLSLFPIHVKKSILLHFKKNAIPEIIISSGRRTASMAVYLKKLSKGKSKIIQIMRPNLDPKEFALIILPQHDNFNYTIPNIVRIIGALTNVQEKVAKNKDEFDAKYPDIKKFIAVIIGGSTKKYTLTLENAKLLEGIISKVVESHALTLFITFSRRTPANVKKYFREKFSEPNIIYDVINAGPNPYPVILQKAEYIISTTDSISMCSESASIGKPVYIFCPVNFKLKKHNFFIQQLVDLGMVRRLEATTYYLEKYEYKPLSELNRVVNFIKEKIL